MSDDLKVEYILCAASSPRALNDWVNELLARGWSLYGSPFGTALKKYDDIHQEYCQALTRYK